MPAPRKIFRIEETPAARLRPNVEPIPGSPHHREIVEALSALRAAMASPLPAVKPVASANAALIGEEAAHLTRITHELDAVMNGTQQATQKVLAATEEIDQLANNLSAALKGMIEQDAAQDIRDLVVRIFEACNFQDLIGQRITKVMASLQFIEQQIAQALDDARSDVPAQPHQAAEQFLHGPRLDSDYGHVTQNEIDVMFEKSA